MATAIVDYSMVQSRVQEPISVSWEGSHVRYPANRLPREDAEYGGGRIPWRYDAPAALNAGIVDVNCAVQDLPTVSR